MSHRKCIYVFRWLNTLSHFSVESRPEIWTIKKMHWYLNNKKLVSIKMCEFGSKCDVIWLPLLLHFCTDKITVIHINLFELKWTFFVKIFLKLLLTMEYLTILKFNTQPNVRYTDIRISTYSIAYNMSFNNLVLPQIFQKSL